MLSSSSSSSSTTNLHGTKSSMSFSNSSSSVSFTRNESCTEYTSVLVPASKQRKPGVGFSQYRMRGMMNAAKRSKKNASTGKKLTWAAETFTATGVRGVSINTPLSNGGIPRRLNLQEKVDLYASRPDLDLAGIMERLEAIKRLERMSMMHCNGGHRKCGGDFYGMYDEEEAKASDEDEDVDDEELEDEEEEKDDDFDEEDSDVEMKEDEADERVEEETFYDACSNSTGFRMHKISSSSSSSADSSNNLERRAVPDLFKKNRPRQFTFSGPVGSSSAKTLISSSIGASVSNNRASSS